jgi:hypothetical protein
MGKKVPDKRSECCPRQVFRRPARLSKRLSTALFSTDAAWKSTNFELILISINPTSTAYSPYAIPAGPSLTRRCAFCGTQFTLPHRRRSYCSNSCNTRACVARKAAKERVDSPLKPLGAPAAGAPAAVMLAVNAQNVALLALAPQVPKAMGAVL